MKLFLLIIFLASCSKESPYLSEYEHLIDIAQARKLEGVTGAWCNPTGKKRGVVLKCEIEACDATAAGEAGEAGEAGGRGCEEGM